MASKDYYSISSFNLGTSTLDLNFNSTLSLYGVIDGHSLCDEKSDG